MGSQRFRAVVVAGARDGAAIMMPFDPDEAWGAKADHPVSGTVGGCRIRTRLVPGEGGWMLTLAPKRLISTQFYRKAYLRWIDSTTRRPDLRAARIAEVVGLLAAGVKERPRP